MADTATGLDLSTDLLQVARLLATEERLRSASFVAVDAQTFPLPAGGWPVG